MKKIKYLGVMLLIYLILPISVLAAGGSIKVTGTSSAVVENTVSITVTISSGTPIGSWDLNLSYDKSFLQLISANSESGSTSMVGVTTSGSGVKSKSYSFKFKALKSGTTKVGISGYTVYAMDESDMSMSISAKGVRIMTQAELEASYSKDNNLKSLEVDGFTLNTPFNKDTLEYSVVVPEDTKEINIKATPSDNKSSVSGAGVLPVTAGTNTFQIVVRAENGSEKTYTLKVEVKDANPIHVTIDNEDYTVVKIKENLPTINGYQEYTVKINDFDIPAYKNDNTNIVLVGLKKSDGSIDLFIYDEKTKEYKNYTEIGKNAVVIYPLPLEDELEGYMKKTIEINGQTIECLVFNEDSRFAILYGMNIETGEKSFYQYDTIDQTIIKYNDEYINSLIEKNELYSYIIIGFSVILVLLFLIIIFRKPKKAKDKKALKKDKKKKKHQDVLNEDNLEEEDKD